MTRLVKGLASSRKGARQGFATVLTEVLSEFNCLSPEKVLRLIAKNLEVTGSAKAWVRHYSYTVHVQLYIKAVACIIQHFMIYDVRSACMDC